MRKTYVYLLKSLLVIGLLFGCTPKDESPAPTNKATSPTPAKPTSAKTPQEPFGIELKGPSKPATLLNSTPTGYSALRAFGCIVLEFDKKPENFKTQPALEFCSVDEAEHQFGAAQRTLKHLRMAEGAVTPFFPLGYAMYISAPADRFQSSRTEDRYWVFEASWGEAAPRHAIRLLYIFSGL